MNTPIQLPLPLASSQPAEGNARRHLNFPLNLSLSEAQMVEIQHRMSLQHQRRRAQSSSFTRYHSLRSA
jgi:hypothetical protein